MFLIPKEVENKGRFSWGCECRHQNAEASKRGLRGGIRQFSSLLRCVAKIPCRKEVTRFFFKRALSRKANLGRKTLVVLSFVVIGVKIEDKEIPAPCPYPAL